MTPVRLALGTAQLGMVYGVANALGRPSPDEAARILDVALASGIDYIDTAAAYGDAEAIVGRALRARGATGRVRVCTKLSALPPGLVRQDLARVVRAAIDGSRSRLGVEVIDDLLIHAAEDLAEYGDAVVEVLSASVEAGAVRRVGVSAYEPVDARWPLSHRVLRVVQFPFNVFDRRWDADVQARLRADGVAMFARSVLLQGLFVLPPDRAEAAAAGAGPWVAALQAACAAHGVPVLVAALAYAAAGSGADRLVVGVESAAQLQQLTDAARAQVSDAFVSALDRACTTVPAGVRDPRQWRRPS